jgi:hypothetical protein
MEKEFYFLGRPDGIGNRIEQLIYIQEYCIKNDMKCIYIWINQDNFRSYKIGITFENIEIRYSISNEEKNKLLKSPFMRSPEYIVKFKFNFNINNFIKYDSIIHVRGTDRLTNEADHYDFSTIEMLNSYINKTINYINNDSSILTYTIVSDDNKYINEIKSKINKEFVELVYNYDIDKDWLDFYYLTRPQKYIIMCCQFSSYSITASILGNKEILVFKNSLKSNLPRYKANVRFIDS